MAGLPVDGGWPDDGQERAWQHLCHGHVPTADARARAWGGASDFFDGSDWQFGARTTSSRVVSADATSSRLHCDAGQATRKECAAGTAP
eukprot:12806979-Heterocapsa_arctica.AAC.1